MNNTLLDTVAACSKDLMKFGFSVEEFATLVQENNMTDAEVLAVAKVFEHLKAKKDSSTVDFLLRTSRLPLKVPKTFDNFDFSRLHGKSIERLTNLPALTAVYAHRNLAFIGPQGVGKTHLAMAYGRACCEKGLKAFFLKASELNQRLLDARRMDRCGSAINFLVKPSCLIIDEVGHCEFDKESTRLFFDMVDRRYQKDGYYNMVFTSNRDPAQWQENFCENDSLLCALDRIFDDAIVFSIKGESFRGRRLETVSLRSSAASPTAAPSQKSGI